MSLRGDSNDQSDLPSSDPSDHHQVKQTATANVGKHPGQSLTLSTSCQTKPQSDSESDSSDSNSAGRSPNYVSPEIPEAEAESGCKRCGKCPICMELMRMFSDSDASSDEDRSEDGPSSSPSYQPASQPAVAARLPLTVTVGWVSEKSVKSLGVAARPNPTQRTQRTVWFG